MAPLWLALVIVAVTPAVDAGATPAPRFLDHHELPAGTRFGGTCVGGLSALAYDAGSGRYFAVADDARGARLYQLRIELELAAAPRIAGVAVERVVRLLTREGVPYPDDRVDPEGLALLDDGSAFLSSEGVATSGVPPFVDLIALDDGAWLGAVPVPVAFRPRREGGSQTRGVRRNLGFEALTLSPDRRTLYAGAESALVQDLAPGKRRYARILRWTVDADGTASLDRRYLYPLATPDKTVLVYGLVELLALDDDGRLLALERTFGPLIGMRVELFAVDLGRTEAGAERGHLPADARALPVLEKRRLLDFATLPAEVDNYEGLTFGPPLPGGARTLLVIGDNDDPGCAPGHPRPTRFLLFRLDRAED